MFCRKCGHQFDGSFCSQCGTPLQNVQEEEEPSVLKAVLKGGLGIFKTTKVIVGTILIVIMLVIILESQGANIIDLPVISGDKYTDMVKYRTRNGYDISYTDAFDNFFSSPEWRYFIGENKERIVEFTGKCSYNDNQIDVRMQFTLSDDLEQFNLSYLEYNEISQNKFEITSMLDTVFNDYNENT